MTRPCRDALDILAADPHDLELDDHDLEGIERVRARTETVKPPPPRERRPEPIPVMRVPVRV